jgi:hypothetical protein
MLSREQKLDKRFNFSQICCKKVKDTFFGGAEKDAAKAQAKAQAAAAGLTAERLVETEAQVSPFISQEAGPSLQAQQALSGALGPEAQAQAFANFQEDPGTEFLREQGLRLVTSGAGVSGNLGGGERLRELTKFSQGLALQDLGNRFNRLGATSAGEQALTARQQAAATNLGSLRSGLTAQQSSAIIGEGQAKAEGLVASAAGLRGGITQLAAAGEAVSGGGGPAAALSAAFGV